MNEHLKKKKTQISNSLSLSFTLRETLFFPRLYFSSPLAFE